MSRKSVRLLRDLKGDVENPALKFQLFTVVKINKYKKYTAIAANQSQNLSTITTSLLSQC